MELLFDNYFSTYRAKPFLKWAGGKGQLIKDIAVNLPTNMNEINTFVEPFLGSGAVLFWMLNNYPSIQQIVVNDFNKDLVNTYKAVKSDVINLIEMLRELENKYKSLDFDSQQELFYVIREKYNERETIEDKTRVASYFIFLNRTCFNGLYRVNSKNSFNVPFGKYSSPTICDEETLKEDNKLLQRVEIRTGDYSSCIDLANENSLYYLDPPYRPLSLTSSFNSYTKCDFNDTQQERLKSFCDEISNRGALFMLSNSDPLSANEDPFFDNLYLAYTILRVKAKRNINSKANGRGAINEILVKNY